ncbi:hypothetical protein [Halovenus salina]|uniref:Uncharacterized protein n=1 Tax=Halovenus salina TaxID=1510225 RepID=A0ABD5W7K5_9EURY|nr:hypothetical protein [Halovenus salina]
MRQLPPVTGTANRKIDDRKNWVANGLLVTVLGLPAIVAFMAAPSVILGAVLGIVGLRLTERASERADTDVVGRPSRSLNAEGPSWKSTAD